MDCNWKKWTVILGDNGTGKSTILKCIAGMNSGHSIYFGRNEEFSLSSGLHIPKLKSNTQIELSLSKSQTITYIHTTFKFDLISDEKPLLKNLPVFGYGANRFMSNKSIADDKTGNTETLFNDDAKLINAEEWLLQLDYAASKDSEIKEFAIKRRDQVKQTLNDLLPDIEDIRFSTPTRENLKSTVEFKTPYGWVTIHQLSLGYKTMVAWMVDLAAGMFEHDPYSDNPLAKPAIVLVDEIDLHMLQLLF